MTEIVKVSDEIVDAHLVTKNPAWDYIKDVPDDTMFSKYGNESGIFTPSSYDIKNHIAHRDRVVSRWTWAIPSPDAIETLVDFVNGRGVVEIGAGNGYWAWMLSQHGVNVNAYDLNPVGTEKSWFKDATTDPNDDHMSSRSLAWEGAGFTAEQFHPVQEGGPEMLGLRENRDRVLFMCWPTMDSWAAEAVNRFYGDKIAFIGESNGGCTASSEFFRLVGDSDACGCWDEVCECPPVTPIFQPTDSYSIVQWSGLNDYMSFYERLR